MLPVKLETGFESQACRERWTTLSLNVIVSKTPQLPKKKLAKDGARLEKLDKKINALKMELRAEVAASEVPQFLRDIRVSDGYIMQGSSAGYQAFAVFGGDPMLGELFGAGTGIVTTFLACSGNDAEKMLKKYNLTTDMEERDLNLASMLLNNMTDMSPEFRAAVNTCIEYQRTEAELIQVYDPRFWSVLLRVSWASLFCKFSKRVCAST